MIFFFVLLSSLLDGNYIVKNIYKPKRVMFYIKPYLRIKKAFFFFLTNFHDFTFPLKLKLI